MAQVAPEAALGSVMPLGRTAPVYDWKNDDGFHNLLHWADRAAIAAGR
jgi:hypothetical protein